MLKRTALLALYCAFILTVTELVFRLDWLRYHPSLGTRLETRQIRESEFFSVNSTLTPPYRLKPNAAYQLTGALFKTNGQGYMGDTESDPKKINLLFLGDSVTFGHGVKPAQAFPALIKERLPGSRVAIVAVPGYNTDDEAVFLEEVLRSRRFVPDVVILQFGANDFWYTTGHTRRGRPPYDSFYQTMPTLTFGEPTGLYRYLLQNSELFLRLHHAATLTLTSTGWVRPFPDRCAQLSHALTRIRALSHEVGAKTIFCFCPYRDRSQLDSQAAAQIARFENMMDASIDLSQSMENKPALWWNFYHPSAEGHRLIAEALYEKLSREGFLKK
ncbi:MAG: SGNH/GDSL hydrolase family protein [Candidatus Omnitrophota bacterium]